VLVVVVVTPADQVQDLVLQQLFLQQVAEELRLQVAEYLAVVTAAVVSPELILAVVPLLQVVGLPLS
jgi:hypothetical protein